jgi:uncharacterized protein YgiB involved in biofilm formation
MAKFSKKVMGKEVGSADVYAEPHTMDGKKSSIQADSKYETGAERMNKMNISTGGISKGSYTPENANGEVKMRGTGAATKGLMCRGPMA